MDSSAPPGRTAVGDVGAILNQAVAMLRRGSSSLTGLLVLELCLIALFWALLPDSFPQVSTLQAIMFQLPELGILSLAMAIPLLSGGLNLATVATTNQAALLMAWMLTIVMPPDAGGVGLALWIALSLALGLALCVLIGLATGILIAVAGVHPILVTLGTMTMVSGFSVYFSRGTTLSGFPEPLLRLANDTVFGVPLSFLLFVALAILVHVLLTRTALGVRIHMSGSNLEATRFSGVDTRRVLITVYVLSSVLCWVGALVMMSRFNSASAAYAESYLLITILAAILGGIDPYGGFGRIAGLAVALCVLQTIASGFNLLGLSPYLSLTIWGVTLLAVMGVKRLARALLRGPA